MVHYYFNANCTQPDIDSSSSSDCENSDERLDTIINSILANLTLNDSNMTIKKYKKERNKHERNQESEKPNDKIARNINHYPYGAASSDSSNVSPRRPVDSHLYSDLRLSQPSNPKRCRTLLQTDNVNNPNTFETKIAENSGNNSEDEYFMATGSRTTRRHYQIEEHEMRMLLKEKKGWKIVSVEADGACLFRAVSHQIFGKEEEHKLIRDQVINYMKQNKEHFSPFISEDFDRYLLRKLDPHTHGNHVEIQAISELYNRPVEIYFNSLEPINVFHREYNDLFPIRLSYHGGIHYNSIVDPQNPTYGAGLGMPNYQPTLSEKELVEKAKAESEINDIETTLLQEELKKTETLDLEDRITEEVAKKSRLEYLQTLKSKKPSASLKSPVRQNSKSPQPPCSSSSSAETVSQVPPQRKISHNSDSLISNVDNSVASNIPSSSYNQLPITNTTADSASCSYITNDANSTTVTNNSQGAASSVSESHEDYLLRHVPQNMLDMDEETILALVMENSRQEYINSNRKDKSSF